VEQVVAYEVNQTHDMFSLADQLRERKNKKKQLEKELKELKAEIEQIEQELVDIMLQEEMQNFTRSGQMFYLQTRTYASAVAEKKQELFIWLKENGYGDLVYETINANSLAAFIRELLEEEEELPKDLRDLVNVYEKTTIGMRRASK